MKRLPYVWFLFFLIVVFAFVQPSGPTSFAQTVPPPTRSAYLPLVSNFIPSPTPTFTATPTPKPTATATLPPPTATSDPSQGDIRPPQLVTWSFSPTVINVAEANQTITFVAHFTDDLSGLGGATQARFRSPSNHQLEDVVFSYPRDLISGTAQDGIYRSTLVLPRFSESGTWKLEYVFLEDNVGNRIYLKPAQLDSRKLPTSFKVINQ